MQTHTTPSGKQILLPITANEFELYASMPGSEIAANELFQALTTIADEIDPFAVQGYAPTPKTLRALFERVEAVLDRHGDVGGQDSEPFNVCHHAVEKIAHVIAGTNVRF